MSNGKTNPLDGAKRVSEEMIEKMNKIASEISEKDLKVDADAHARGLMESTKDFLNKHLEK